MNQVTITEEQAEGMARTVRGVASRQFNDGTFTRYCRGMVQGKLTLIMCHLRTRPWVLQGIANEIDYLCRRACEEGQ